MPRKKIKLEEAVDTDQADAEMDDDTNAEGAGEHSKTPDKEDFDDEFKEFFVYDGEAAAAAVDGHIGGGTAPEPS